MKKCAILLSGGISFSYNYARYKEDLYLAYNVLKNIADFTDENIFLFYGNGTEGFEGTEIILHAAYKNQLLKCLEDMENKLVEDDEFVLVVSNHGGDEEGGSICLWGNEYVTLRDLSEYLNKIKAKKIVVLGQCFSGNILKYDISNSCIFTANEQNKPSYSFRENYDEFVYHFFSYILGMYPDTENRIPQGKNNLIEAYQYAKKQDVLCPDNERRKIIIIDGNEITEIPQMKSNLEGLSVEF